MTCRRRWSVGMVGILMIAGALGGCSGDGGHGNGFHESDGLLYRLCAPSLAPRLVPGTGITIAGRIHVSGKNIKLSRSEMVMGSAPLPGQHTVESSLNAHSGRAPAVGAPRCLKRAP